MDQKSTVQTIRAVVRLMLREADGVEAYPNVADLNLPPADPNLGPNLYKSATGEYVYVPNFNLDLDLSKLPDPWAAQEEEQASDDAGLKARGIDVLASPDVYNIKQGDPFSDKKQLRSCGNPPDPKCEPYREHWGADLSRKDMGVGAHIVAPLGGTVKTFALDPNNPNSGPGNKIELNHGNGIKTVYMHLNGFAVPSGTPVKAGDVIGYLGDTGRSTGPHLHFEVRSTSSGDAQDPLEWLKSNPEAYFPIKVLPTP
jgi:murein DD-endopeptidase MepM/ murein hydrolase activator NlpD